MLLVRINAKGKTVSVVSIPRDSKVYLAGNRGVDKVNAAHALGGPEMAVQTVQEAFGIPVDNFIVVNLHGVRELVDSLGGVDLYIEKPMRYRDYTAKLHINFDPGYRHLNGEEAEGFLRFRHDELGDIGRIRRQQQFLMAVANKLKNPMVVTQIPQLVKIADQYVETDLAPNELLTLAFFAKDLKTDNIRTATLPGQPGGTYVSYWVVDPNQAQVILDRLILNNAYSARPMDPTVAGTPLKVGVFYNPALGEDLAAVTQALEASGFEVVCKERQRRNGTQIIEHTQRVNDDLTSKIRRSDPRLSSARLIFAPVGTTFERTACSSAEDYTVVLGGDLQKPAQ